MHRNKPKDVAISQGFTLLEILLVISIIAIASAIIAPSFFSAASLNLNDEGKRLLQVMRLANDEATLTGKNHRLLFSSHTYSLQRQNDDGTWRDLQASPFQAYHLATDIAFQDLLPQRDLPDTLLHKQLQHEAVLGFIDFPMTGLREASDLQLINTQSSELQNISLRPGPDGIQQVKKP